MLREKIFAWAQNITEYKVENSQKKLHKSSIYVLLMSLE